MKSVQLFTNAGLEVTADPEACEQIVHKLGPGTISKVVLALSGQKLSISLRLETDRDGAQRDLHLFKP